jgi:hypothetical protein
MADQAKPKKSFFDYIQSIFMLMTPILVAFLGYFFNNKVDEIKNKIENVQAMIPFMDMLLDTTDTTKNIMGAYGIYMLKQGDDSKIAARMIAATQKSHLADVLRDIGKDDDSVRKVLDDLYDNPLGITPEEYSALDDSIKTTLELTPLQVYALNVKHDIDLSQLRKEASKETVESKEDNTREVTAAEKKPASFKSEGWIYLGNLKTGLIINIPNELLVKVRNKSGEINMDNYVFKLKKATNLRSGKPDKSNGYKLQPFLKALKVGTEIKITEYDLDKKDHFWVKIGEL